MYTRPRILLSSEKSQGISQGIEPRPTEEPRTHVTEQQGLI